MSTIEKFHEQLKATGAIRGELYGRETILHFGDPAAEYEAVRRNVAVADVSDRTQVSLAGDDRANFLHNLCTNDIRKLVPGGGCEAFLLDAQGRILAYVFVFSRDDSIIVESSPGHTDAILSQLDRYLIREKVELSDASQAWGELLLAGPRISEVLEKLGAQLPGAEPTSNGETHVAGHAVQLRRVDLSGTGSFLIAAQRGALLDVWNALCNAGTTPIGAAAVDTARIEAGSPMYGVDILPRSLPQEIARDDRAINFTKGCYIGQETVARIDARGHVNKFLVGVCFKGREVPAADTPLSNGSSEVGNVTSATFSGTLDAPLAMAYVKRGCEGEGQALESPNGQATIVKLPL